MQDDQVGSSPRNRRTKESTKSEQKRKKKTGKVTDLSVYSFQFPED